MNQVTATFNSCGYSSTAPLYQYDYGQKLVFDGFDLPAAFEVHFSNGLAEDTTTQIGADNAVDIPDAYLLTGKNISAWIYLHTDNDDGETTYFIEIPVTERAKPSDLEPAPVQQDAITQAIAALNNAVNETEQSVIDATESEEAARLYAQAAGDHAADAQRYAEQAAESAAVFTGIDIKATDDGAGNVTLSLEVASNA